MEHIFKLANLDCANCAAELERDIAKISGVDGCRVSFLTLKMYIESDSMDSDLIGRIVKTAKKGHRVRVSYE